MDILYTRIVVAIATVIATLLLTGELGLQFQFTREGKLMLPNLVDGFLTIKSRRAVAEVDLFPYYRGERLTHTYYRVGVRFAV